ncbi:GNAT family N-acetyltransferase [Streptomyces sp. NPDC002454]
MTLTFERDPAMDDALADALVDLWVDVTNAGGAVGFLAPVAAAQIQPAVDAYAAALAEGRTRLLLGRDEHGRPAATAFLSLDSHPLTAHWASLYTVMVHPKLQGGGRGRDLMAAAADLARDTPGIEAVRLSCRGGLGLERFYASCGYREVGRVPAAVRVAPGDDRDEVLMLLPLRRSGSREGLPETAERPG